MIHSIDLVFIKLQTKLSSCGREKREGGGRDKLDPPDEGGSERWLLLSTAWCEIRPSASLQDRRGERSCPREGVQQSSSEDFCLNTFPNVGFLVT